MILLDIKSIDNIKCRELTGAANDNALELLNYLETIKKPVWIRHVVVPGITENYEDIDMMGQYLAGFSIIERVEILPFHKMGEFKWKELNMKYELYDTPAPAEASILKIKDILKKYGLKVV